VQEILHAGGKAIAVGASVSKEEDVAKLFEETKKAYGHIDVLVNNAGVFAVGPLDNLTVSEYNRHFDTNVLGVLLVTKAALPLFPETGGSIVNLGSIVSTLAPPNGAVYVGTKGAVDAITKSLAKEFAGKKIRVNGVNPGMVVTEGTHAAGMLGTEFETAMLSMTPLGRLGQPSDIAAAIAFLSSDEASWITGESLIVSGGAGM
jgi:3-oxoacyl-[acyl-carrier protein] reductase